MAALEFVGVAALFDDAQVRMLQRFGADVARGREVDAEPLARDRVAVRCKSACQAPDPVV